MLRGTGLGADTGVVIEAKMIDALLSDRPDERRELFEEAAGVGLYRDRRRTTERRLEETTVDLQRLDDLIGEVQTQVRSLARQRKRAERHAELMRRRFAVELNLAAREMEAWREELARLETRVSELRETLPNVERGVDAAGRARDEAHGRRAAAEGQRAELLRLVIAQREHVLQIRSEMAVAEERQRNAVARRQRAETEASEGHAHGQRIADDREQAASERARHESALAAAREELELRQHEEEISRSGVAGARVAVDEAEQHLRDAHDRTHRMEHERERAGEGAILGPLSDFITADQASALLVERFLGPTVHAVLVRDAAVAEAVREWHGEAHPGSLLLLPLDSPPGVERNGDDSLSRTVEATPAARDWVRTLLGGVRTLEGGGAFVDPRGAVWLPGQGGGPGPLRRRAELYALRAELSASEVALQQASAAA